MYVKVEPSGCCERRGMVQVRLCMYLSSTDYNYEIHHGNPFHNHIIYVEPDISDTEILDIGEVFLAEGYIKWEGDETLDLGNLPFTPPVIDTARLEAVAIKVQHLKETVLERTI